MKIFLKKNIKELKLIIDRRGERERERKREEKEFEERLKSNAYDRMSRE